MARRSSNRDRIDRMRAEAEATAREKEEKAKAKPAATTSRSRAASKAEPPGRMKIVWAVKCPAGKIVKTFPYPLKAKAQAEADRLTEEVCKEYMVRPEKVPMD